MDANAVQVLQLRGGDLTRLKGSKWVFCRGADVVLPERFLAFLAERVKCVDAALDAAHFAVKAVDKALPDGRGSDDLWGCFRGQLQHGAGMYKLDREAKLRGQAVVPGQLLWACQVSDTSGLLVLQDHFLFYSRDGGWQDLGGAKRNVKRVKFADVWALCEKQGGASDSRTQVVQLSDFLRRAGARGKLPCQWVAAWTCKKNKFGVRKRQFWKQPWASGRGTSERWVASKDTLRIVWKSLLV